MKQISFRPRNLCLGMTCAAAVLMIVGMVISANGKCIAMVPAVMAAGVSALLGLLGAGRTAFERRQLQEERDAEEYHRQHGSAELFGDADEAVKMATRSNRQYVKYFVPAFTIALGIVLGILVLSYWFSWRPLTTTPPAPAPLPMAILAFCCCIATLIAGSFFIGASRERGCRWVRPSAAWLFMGGFLSLLGSGVMFCEHFGKWAERADITMARVGIVLLGILAVELILSFVIEFYRPRMPGEEERPLPESRFLALFTEPGGVARNVADSLDYQFGFRVSEAWFYHFLERTIVPLLMGMVVAFWLMSCIIVVSPSETALRERFGRVISETPLEAGVYFKLPYPFESIYRYSSTRVQQITIENLNGDGDEEHHPGEEHEGEGEEDEAAEAVILWNMEKKHGDEADFLVGDLKNGGSRQGVGLLSAHIPLFYKVNNLYQFTCKNREPEKLLKNLAQRELLEYFIQADWNDLLGAGRGKATEILRERIQKAADRLELGVDIVFVALTGLHPPVGVGASFDGITASTVNRQRLRQDAETDAHRILSQAKTAALVAGNLSVSYRDTKVSQAAAESGRFDGQLKCFQASPELYRLNSYYDTLESATGQVRKFVLTGAAKDQVLWLNLERKNRSGLLDLNMGGQ